MHRIASQVVSSKSPSFVHIAFTVVALVGLSMARPGLASEVVGASAPPALTNADLRAATPMPAMARVDLDGFTRHALVVAAPERADAQVGGGPDRHGASEAAKPAAASLGSIEEPATIAVLGFAAAALIALRRRKNAEEATILAARQES